MNIGQREPRCITVLCSLLGFSRQALYQKQLETQSSALKEDLLIQQIGRIRVLQKRVGGRKLLLMLNQFMEQHTIAIGRDYFFDLLRENGLLIKPRKRSRPVTTNSWHHFHKFPNLILQFIPTAANQLWVCDITYIHLHNDFAYLSLITDAYSRKITGFYLHKTLSAQGSVRALQMALKSLPANHKLIHHSDRGTQYCCAEYVTVLLKNKIKISMTQSGDPLENAIAERVNGILKDELLEVKYPSFEKAQLAVAVAISTYNHHRLHSSVDMLTPVEAHQLKGTLKKHWKNYYIKQNEKEVTYA